MADDIAARASVIITVTDNGTASKTAADIGGIATAAETAGSRAATGMGGASASMEELSGKTVSATYSMQQMGAAATMLGAMLLAPIKDATDAFVKYNAALTNVAAEGALGNLTMDETGKQLQGIALNAGQSSQALAEGLYKVGAAGYTGADGMAVMAQSAKAATADQADLAGVSQAMIAMLGAYKNASGDAALGVNAVQKASDIMLGTVANGVLRVDEFAANIAKIAPLGAQMGVGLNELGAGMATLTKQGLTATQATNELSAIMSSLLKPSKALQEQFAADGVASGEALIQARGFGGALEYLKEASGGSDEKLAHLIPNIRSIKGEISLASGEFQSYNDTLASVDKATQGLGQTQEAFNIQTTSAKFALDQAKEAMAQAGQAAGAALAPFLLAAADAVKSLAEWFANLPGPVQTAIVATTAFVGGLLVVGGAIAILMTAITAIGAGLAAIGVVAAALVSPVAIAVGAMVAAAALIISNWDEVAKFFRDLPGEIGGWLGGLGSTIGDAFKQAWVAVSNWFTQDLPAQLKEWGGNLIGFLAEGIVNSIPLLGPVTDAIGSFLGFQMTPHSPPPFAPWMGTVGQQWVALMGQGMTNADFSFVDQLGATLKTRFDDILGTNNQFNVATAVFGTQGDIAVILNQLAAGATLTDTMLNKVRADLQGQGADVVALIQAYAAVAEKEKEIAGIQKDITLIQDNYKQSIADSKQALDGVNIQLQISNDHMRDLKGQEYDQQDLVQPYLDTLKTANDQLKDAQTAYDQINTQIQSINQAQQEGVDILNRQINLQDYQANKAMRGDTKALQGTQDKITDENLTYSQQNLDLQHQLDAAKESGDKAAQAAIKGQMSDARLAHEDRLASMRAEQEVERNTLEQKKNALQEADQPLKDQADDVKHQNDAQIASLYTQRDQAKATLDGAKVTRDAAQEAVDQHSVQLNSIKAEEAAQQRVIERLNLKKSAAQETYDGWVKLSDRAVADDNAQIKAIQLQEAPLKVALQMAHDRVKAEDQVVTAINAQTTAMQNQANAKAKGGGAAAKAEAKPDDPLKDMIATDNAHIAGVKSQYDAIITPLQAEYERLKGAGDDTRAKVIKGQLDDATARYTGAIAVFKAEKDIHTGELDKAGAGLETYGQAADSAKTKINDLHTSIAQMELTSSASPVGGHLMDAGQLAASSNAMDNLSRNTQVAANSTNNLNAQQQAGAAATAKLSSNTLDLAASVAAIDQVHTESTTAGSSIFGISIPGLSTAADGINNVSNALIALKSTPAGAQAVDDLTTSLQGLKDKGFSASEALTYTKTFSDALHLTPDEVTQIYNSVAAVPTSMGQSLTDGRSVVVQAQSGTIQATLDKTDSLLGYTPGTSKAMYDRGTAALGGLLSPFINGVTNVQNALQTGIGQPLLDFSHVGLGIGEGTGTSTVSASWSTAMISSFVSPLAANPLTAPLAGALNSALTAANTQINDPKTGVNAVGQSIPNGMAAGITGAIMAVGGIVDAAIGAVEAAKKAAQQHAKMGSPSRLFADEVGKHIGDGIWVGILETIPAGQTAAQQYVDALSSTMQGSIDKAIPRTTEALRRALATLDAEKSALSGGAGSGNISSTLERNNNQHIVISGGHTIDLNLTLNAHGVEVTPEAMDKLAEHLKPAMQQVASTTTAQAMKIVARGLAQT